MNVCLIFPSCLENYYPIEMNLSNILNVLRAKLRVPETSLLERNPHVYLSLYLVTVLCIAIHFLYPNHISNANIN